MAEKPDEQINRLLLSIKDKTGHHFGYERKVVLEGEGDNLQKVAYYRLVAHLENTVCTNWVQYDPFISYLENRFADGR